MDADMDFEQGGSANALAIFQEEYNAQQRPPPSIEHDRKMLYVDLFVAAPLSTLLTLQSDYDTLQRSRLYPRLHRQPGVLHLLRDEEHPAHLREHLPIGQAAGPRGPARRPRRLSRSPAPGPHLRDAQLWLFVGH